MGKVAILIWIFCSCLEVIIANSFGIVQTIGVIAAFHVNVGVLIPNSNLLELIVLYITLLCNLKLFSDFFLKDFEIYMAVITLYFFSETILEHNFSHSQLSVSLNQIFNSLWLERSYCIAF
jgi:hypothetical protein